MKKRNIDNIRCVWLSVWKQKSTLMETGLTSLKSSCNNTSSLFYCKIYYGLCSRMYNVGCDVDAEQWWRQGFLKINRLLLLQFTALQIFWLETDHIINWLDNIFSSTRIVSCYIYVLYVLWHILIHFDSSGKVFLLSFLPFFLHSTSFQVSIPYQVHQTTFQSNFPFHSVSKLNSIFSLKSENDI